MALLAVAKLSLCFDTVFQLPVASCRSDFLVHIFPLRTVLGFLHFVGSQRTLITGPNTVSFSLPSPESGNRFSFQNVVFSNI
jgi:hypothetical protein